MSLSIKRALDFPITKISIGIVIPFSLFVLIQNLVLKLFFYCIIQDKSVATPIIHALSLLVLIVSYYYLLRFLSGSPLCYLVKREGQIVEGKLFKR